MVLLIVLTNLEAIKTAWRETLLCSNDLLPCGESVTLMSMEIRLSAFSEVTAVTLLIFVVDHEKRGAAHSLDVYPI